MNLISSYFKIKKISLIAISCLSLTFIASAEECATLRFQPLKVDNTHYVAKIIGHNGIKQEYSDSQRKLINSSSYSYHLKPGEHFLNIAIAPKLSARELLKMKHANKELLSFLENDSIIQSTTVLITAKTNTLFNINFSQIEAEKEIEIQKGKEVFAPQIKVEQSECDDIQGNILSSRNFENNVREVSSTDLPVDIEYRLRQLMTKINLYNKNNSRDYSKNILPVMGIDIFGVMVDSDYADDGKALKVLSVLPYSQASKMNFLSGDTITHLGGEEVKSQKRKPSQVFTDYLNTLRIGGMIDVRIKRNGSSRQLTGKFIPEMLPESSYYISSSNTVSEDDRALINYTELPSMLKFEYEQLMLELFNFYSKNNLPLESISLAREPLVDTRFGMTGNTVNTKDFFGVVINNIDIEGIAEKLGLRVGDNIIKINNESLSHDNVNKLISSLTKLNPGQLFSVTIKRKGKTLILEQEYQPTYFSAFNLDVNLNSKVEADHQISEMAKNYTSGFLVPAKRYQFLSRYYIKGRPSETRFTPEPRARSFNPAPSNGKK